MVEKQISIGNINDKSVITAMLAVNRKVFDNLFAAKLLNMS
jgi:hypothetical protein